MAFGRSSGARWRRPFGTPSDELCLGILGDTRVVFLPRHGRGHALSPSDINYCANIDALKRVGVTDVLSLSAVGSLKEAYAPGCFVLVDQFIDRTVARQTKLSSVVAAWPTFRWRIRYATGWVTRSRHCRFETAGLAMPRGGSYIAIEGPQFSTSRGKRTLSELGLFGHRHDQPAGGQARS